MSIILEALKKAERERSTSGGKEGPAPVPALILREVGKGSSLPLVAIIGVLIVALAGAVLFLAPLGKKWIIALRTAGQKTAIVSQPATSPPTTADMTLLKTQALELFNKGDFEGSLTLWEQVSAAAPADFESINNLGFVLKKLNRLGEAKTAYEKAIGVNPRYAVAFNNLGVLHMEQGDSETARKHLEKAVALNETYADPQLHLALLFEKQRKKGEATVHYRKFLEQSPHLPLEVREKIISKLARLEGS